MTSLTWLIGFMDELRNANVSASHREFLKTHVEALGAELDRRITEREKAQSEAAELRVTLAAVRQELNALIESLNPGTFNGPEFLIGGVRWRKDATGRFANAPICGNCRTFMSLSSGMPGCRECQFDPFNSLAGLIQIRNNALAAAGLSHLAAP